jgi:phosphatidylserine/phosphatidylglycerophosphate/cardiolipin synthase-like enzyme
MLVSLMVVMAVATGALPGGPESCPTLTTGFTPGQKCPDAMVHARNDAKRTILVHAYAFTSTPIAKALLDAHTRGVPVQVILEKRQRSEKYASADFLAN